ncbi:MAG: hypothetical protein PHI31_09840 [Desulfuromonadaceae bacterium]|nr:hypothetical protein [Desulfuromonadaceae bacterium]
MNAQKLGKFDDPLLDRQIEEIIFRLNNIMALKAKIGTTSNYLEVESDGTLVLRGNATGWLDVFFPMSPPKTTGAGNPTLVNWLGNLRNYSFSVNDAHDFDPQEYPHNGKVGATATPHIHFVSRTNVAEPRGIKWEIEYSQQGYGGVFPTPTVVSGEYTVPANTPTNTHVIFDLPTFTTLGPASLMCCRLKRIAATGTAPAADPVVLGVHYHFPVDTPAGSRSIITK